MYKLTERGADALGEQTSDGFLVKARSRFAYSANALRKQPYLFALRLFLYAEHIVTEDDILTVDYTFHDARIAASIIAGTEGNADMWQEIP